MTAPLSATARRMVLGLLPAFLTSIGLAEPRSPRPEPAARVHSIGVPTWIYAEPRLGAQPVGSVRLGQSVPLRDSTLRPGSGCGGGFVAVAPFGYVCLDGAATLDSSRRFLVSMRELAPRPGPLPFRYALSNGAPMYRRLPTPAEWEREERFLGAPGTHAPLSWGNRGHERLAEALPISVVGAPPTFLEAGGGTTSANPPELVRRAIPLGSMVAYSAAFEHAGRTWLASADGTVVPADRVRPFRASRFRGVELGRGLSLPLAWFRAVGRPQYVRESAAGFAPNGAMWPVRTQVALDPDVPPATGADGRRYLATRDQSAGAPLWTAETDATVVVKRPKLPWGVAASERWIEIHITAGTLVAYQGSEPVYATLISPGAGGVPRAGRDPVRESTTPLGVHRITYKYRAQTMSPDIGEERRFWIADVPHTQYFSAPFALHTAYWHESFGEPMSAGCVNLSPADGAWLFDFTGPRVPPEWEGAAPHLLTGTGTVVAVYR